MTPAPKRRWLPFFLRALSGLRLPTFSFAYAASLATLALFFLWALFDSSFFAVSGGHWVYWDELGTRYVFCVVLIACGLVSTALVIFRLFVGNRAGRSLKGYAAATALIGIWLTFLLNCDRGIAMRLKRRWFPLFSLSEWLNIAGMAFVGWLVADAPIVGALCGATFGILWVLVDRASAEK